MAMTYFMKRNIHFSMHFGGVDCVFLHTGAQTFAPFVSQLEPESMSRSEQMLVAEGIYKYRYIFPYICTYRYICGHRCM